jgi:hypothetical protein
VPKTFASSTSPRKLCRQSAEYGLPKKTFTSPVGDASPSAPGFALECRISPSAQSAPDQHSDDAAQSHAALDMQQDTVLPKNVAATV